MANIGAILSTKSVTSAFDAARLLYLKGAIERDEDAGKFRLYPSPSNKRSFFLVDTKDVAGEVSEWTDEEFGRKGLAGSKMYTVPISFGTVVQSVTIQNIQLTCAESLMQATQQMQENQMSFNLQYLAAAIQAAIQTLLQTASAMEKSMSDTNMAIVGNIKP
jgi:hypothetical protein